MVTPLLYYDSISLEVQKILWIMTNPSHHFHWKWPKFGCSLHLVSRISPLCKEQLKFDHSFNRTTPLPKKNKNLGHYLNRGYYLSKESSPYLVLKWPKFCYEFNGSMYWARARFSLVGPFKRWNYSLVLWTIEIW
jgi:hypothetical protein